MTAVEKNSAASEPDEPITTAPAGGWLERVDAWLARGGERLNPILVKETRQALKSRQFAVTFSLVLLLGWVWTMFGVSLIGPTIFYGAKGQQMFSGYYLILSFPLLVIVPFGAFRSLAGEREDGTYELLSITTLRPRQIIGGKLASAVLQMLVYLSAVAPCLGFTYILRGISYPVILFVLFYTVLASLALSVVGLVLATVTQEKHWQILLSVAYLFGLGVAFWISGAFAFGGLSDVSPAFQQKEFWIANAAFLTGYASYFVLLFCVAAAQITFVSENRSSLLRAVMLIQQALFTGWMGWTMVTFPDIILTLPYLIVSGIHWAVMGVFLVGESGEMSLRVKRQLPQSFLGRALFTWFNPGPATGYLFVLVNFFTVLLLAGSALVVGSAAGAWGRLPGWLGPNPSATVAWFGILLFCYLAIYLGIGRLLIALLRRVSPVSMVLGFLLQVLLLLAGCGVPLTIHLMLPDLRGDYSLLEISNPFWTLYEAMESRGQSPHLPVLLTALPLTALAVILANLPAVVAAVREVRIGKPVRVAEEDAELAALRAPAPAVPSSPFD